MEGNHDDTIASNTFVSLKNLGATGYLNCILHQLFQIKQFRYGLINAAIDLTNKLSDDEAKESLLYQSLRMFAFLSLSIRPSFDTTQFCNTYKDEDDNAIDVTQPDDACFFMHLYLQHIEKELKDTIYETPVMDTIKTEMISILCCQNCNVERVYRCKYFTVSLPTQISKNMGETLAKCAEFEELDDVYCQHCHQRTPHCYGKLLYSMPNTMIFNVETGIGEKSYTEWTFPDEINLKQYMYIDNNNDDRNDEYFEYRLVGVIVHDGTADNGFYYSLIKNRNDLQHKKQLLLHGCIAMNGFRGKITKAMIDIISSFYAFYQWHYMRDDSIYCIDKQRVERESFGGRLRVNNKRTATMVIYERKQFMEINQERGLFKISEFKNLGEVNKCIKKSKKIWNEICIDNEKYQIQIMNKCNDYNVTMPMKQRCLICHRHSDMVCSRCKQYWYCCRKHQKIHWKLQHRFDCLAY